MRKAEGAVNEDSGGTLSGTIDSVKITGICDSLLWPYIVAKFMEQPTQECYGQAKGYKIQVAHRAESIDELRQALGLGFLPYIGIRVYENFESEETMKTEIIPVPKGGEIGGHAMVIDSGKDNNEPRCKALNLSPVCLLSTAPVTSKSGIHGEPALV